ncbi:MAG: amidohydrolase [Anaerolineae bacterium]|nr:amidohydrolase [Anaerolineae bacterium]
MGNATVLIENGWVVTVDDHWNVYNPGYVFLRGNLIEAVGEGNAPEALRSLAQVKLNAANKAVMPGMVNAHTHLFQTFLRGLVVDQPLLEWLKKAIWPAASHMSGEEGYWAAMIGLIENIRGGATAVIDHQYIHHDPSIDDQVFRAADQTGVRLLLARGWADTNYHDALKETPERILAESARLYETYHGAASGRLRFEFGPLIPWGCTDGTMRATDRLAHDWNTGHHIHVAETQVEVEMNLRERGMRHIPWLEGLEMLTPRTQLVHSVWLEDSELDLIARRGAVVVHCPISNMCMGSGAARIRDMLRLGINVALASDGPGSNNGQNMLEVLKATAMLAKTATLDAMALLPRDVLWMACRGGAKAFGQPDWIGSLEAGKRADVVIVDLDQPAATPVHSAEAALVYHHGGQMVDTVIVDGNVLMQDKKILAVDEKEVLREARHACKRLFERAGIEG